MKENRFIKTFALSAVAFLFILIVQLSFCNRAKAIDDKNQSTKKSCNTFLVSEIIKPSHYHYKSHLNKNFEKHFNQPTWSTSATTINQSSLVFITGYIKYSYYKKRIKHPLSRAQLQVYLC
ncbi:MAG: hypothetical protein AB7S69_10485 [Salinivirgaceae bacterium]